MKIANIELTTEQFKRAQYHIKALCDIGLDEDDIINITKAGIKAYLHRKKGTTFNENQLLYQLKKLEQATYEDYQDNLGYKNIDNFSFNVDDNSILTKIKLWFEDVPENIKNTFKGIVKK